MEGKGRRGAQGQREGTMRKELRWLRGDGGTEGGEKRSEGGQITEPRPVDRCCTINEIV